MSPADCRARGSAHRGGQPSGNAVRVADAVGVLTQRQPGRLRGVVAFFWGQPVAAADAVKHAGVVVGDFGIVKRGAWCIGHGLLG
jgi:hypothetical protein